MIRGLCSKAAESIGPEDLQAMIFITDDAQTRVHRIGCGMIAVMTAPCEIV